MDTPLKDRTFSYRHHGKEIVRKVLNMIYDQGELVYILFDPINQTNHTASVTLFNQMFQVAGGKVKAEHYKGEKIGGAKQLQNI